MHETTAIGNARIGQKLLIFGVILGMVSLVIDLNVEPYSIASYVSMGIGVVDLVISILGVFRVSGALNYGTGKKLLFCVLICLPRLSLIVLLFLNMKATRYLRPCLNRENLLVKLW